MIRNIILDMGNVLLDYNPQVPLAKFCHSEEEKEVITRELFRGPEWIQGDLGYMDDIERYEVIKKRVEEKYHEALRRCCLEWDICMVPCPGAQEFCKQAKAKGYKLYILSNASTKFYSYFERLLPLSFFDGIVVSADIHIIKPNLAIYEYLLKKHGLEAKECLFVDDRTDNVEAAKKVGMEGFVFEGDHTAIWSALD